MVNSLDVHYKVQEFVKDIGRTVKENERLFEDNALDGYHMNLMSRTTIKSEDLVGMDMEDTLNAILSFNNDITELGFVVDGEEGKVECSDEYEVSDIYFTYSYLTPMILSEEDILKKAKRLTKAWLERKIKPPSQPYNKPIDCSLFDLFLSNDISFKALQKCVYQNCDL